MIHFSLIVFEQDMENIQPIPQKEMIEFTKNRNGYTWTIKILEINIDRLESLNNEMIKRFDTGLNELKGGI